jgi:hypothetical protein
MARMSLHLVLTWFLSIAGLVLATRLCPGSNSAAAILAPLIASAMFVRGLGDSSLDRAQAAGIVWLTLTTIAEVVLARRASHIAIALLGDPSRPSVRMGAIVLWIFAPLLFATEQPDSRSPGD